jgi:hypothetical protein
MELGRSYVMQNRPNLYSFRFKLPPAVSLAAVAQALLAKGAGSPGIKLV